MPSETALRMALSLILGEDFDQDTLSVEMKDGAMHVRNLPRVEAMRFKMPLQVRVGAKPLDPLDPPERSFRSAFEARAAERAESGPRSIGTVIGIASSTSRDWYGTDMHLNALEGMQAQFRAGVPLLPAHMSGFSMPEWDDVIGMSVDAEIRSADVAEPIEGERGYILEVASALYDVPKASELRDRLDAGQPIGQSIGGWFTELAFFYNEDEELERIQVHDVELDHNAVTRAPANPDSTGLANLRSKLTAAASLAEASEPTLTASVPAVPLQEGLPAARSVEPTTSHEIVLDQPEEANQEGVSARDIPGESLDTPNEASEDDATAAEPRSTSETEGDDMTPEEIAQIVARSVEESVKAVIPDAVRTSVESAITAHIDPIKTELAELREKVQVMETRATLPAPAAAVIVEDGQTANAGDAAMRAEVDRLRSLVVKLAETPDRRAVRNVDGVTPMFTSGEGASAAFRSLSTSARDEGVGVALSSVVERHADLVAEEAGPASVRANGSVRNLQRVLCAALRAAEADGLISKPVIGWN